MSSFPPEIEAHLGLARSLGIADGLRRASKYAFDEAGKAFVGEDDDRATLFRSFGRKFKELADAEEKTGRQIYQEFDGDGK